MLLLLEVGRLEVRSILSTEISISQANSEQVQGTGSVPEIVEVDSKPDRTSTANESSLRCLVRE